MKIQIKKQTPSTLRQICETVYTWPPKTLFKVNLSHKLYRLYNEWQNKDRFPDLLGWREGGAYFLARVR